MNDISTFNIKALTYKDFLGMPPTMRLEALERFKLSYEMNLKNNPLAALGGSE